MFCCQYPLINYLAELKEENEGCGDGDFDDDEEAEEGEQEGEVENNSESGDDYQGSLDDNQILDFVFTSTDKIRRPENLL